MKINLFQLRVVLPIAFILAVSVEERGFIVSKWAPPLPPTPHAVSYPSACAVSSPRIWPGRAPRTRNSSRLKPHIIRCMPQLTELWAALSGVVSPRPPLLIPPQSLHPPIAATQPSSTAASRCVCLPHVGAGLAGRALADTVRHVIFGYCSCRQALPTDQHTDVGCRGFTRPNVVFHPGGSKCALYVVMLGGGCSLMTSLSCPTLLCTCISPPRRTPATTVHTMVGWIHISTDIYIEPYL